MLTLLAGRAGSGKTAAILDSVKTDVAAGKPGSTIIVPEQYSHEAERELARICPDSASLYAEVLSFTGLARSLFAKYGGNTAEYLDDGGKLLSMALSLESFGRELPGLRMFGKSAGKAETQEMLVSAVDELKTSGITAEDLRIAAGKLEGILADKLLDLADIFENYSNVIAMSGADSSDVLSDLAELIRKKADVSGWKVYIDGFTDFTAGETAVIEALMLKGADITLCLTFDSLETENEVFRLPAKTARQMKAFASKNGIGISDRIIDPEETAARRDPDILRFAENMFMYSESPLYAGSGAVRLFSCSSVHEECELAASYARKLVRETGCRWRDIAIAVRGFDEYGTVMKRVFEHYEVPLFVSEKTDIFTRPLPALIAYAYEVPASHWSAESVIGYMRTGLTGLSCEECDELENYIFKWQLDERAWRRAGAWHQHPDGFVSSFSEADNIKLSRINKNAKRLAAPLLRFIGRSEKCPDAEGHAKILAELLSDLELPRQLGELRSKRIREERREKASEYRQLWEITVKAIEQCAAVLGSTGMDMDEFGKLFVRMLSKYSVSKIPAALDRICAGDFDRMRHRDIRHLIVLGASDDRLPGGAEAAGVFSESEKERIRTAGIELGAGEDEIWREYTLIYNCFSLPSETLTMSYTTENREGSAVKPAFVMMQAKRMFGTDIVKADPELMRLSAPGPAFTLAAGSAFIRTAATEAASRVFGELEPERLESIRKRAAESRGRLSPLSIARLYGSDTRLSASKAETFAKCKFEYFCKFGLKAKPYEAAELKANEIGSFMHTVFEKTAAEVMSLGGFKCLEDAQIIRIADKHIDDYFHLKFQDFEEKSARFTYLFKRLRSDAHEILRDVSTELRRSDFTPLDFELDISKTENIGSYTLPGADRDMKLSGIIDRIDGWEHDGKLYIRIVDYKTGKKEFRIDNVYYGVDLQMLIYLNALMKKGRERYGKEIVPAGVMYLPARSEIVSVKSSEAGTEDISGKSLERSGFIIDDDGVKEAWENGEKEYFPVKEGRSRGNPSFTKEQLEALSSWVDNCLLKMSDDIGSGEITADPLFSGQNENACMYCDYKDQCGFTDGENGEKIRIRRKLGEEELWARMKCGASADDGGNGGEADA